MKFPRSSGVLLHSDLAARALRHRRSRPARLRFGRFPGGVGPDTLANAAARAYRFGDSPYACYSAFAGNTLLVSPDRLVADRLLSRDDLKGIPESIDGRVEV